jgi:hypothetical protein
MQFKLNTYVGSIVNMAESLDLLARGEGILVGLTPFHSVRSRLRGAIIRSNAEQCRARVCKGRKRSDPACQVPAKAAVPKAAGAR